MLYRRFILQAVGGAVLSLCGPLAADTAQLNVDPSQRFQTIEGFASGIGTKDASPRAPPP